MNTNHNPLKVWYMPGTGNEFRVYGLDDNFLPDQSEVAGYELAKQLAHSANAYPELIALARRIKAHFAGTDARLGIEADVLLGKVGGTQ